MTAEGRSLESQIDGGEAHAAKSAVGVRLRFVDALRGLAAFAVMLYHFSGHRIFGELRNRLPRIFFDSMQQGDLGVQVFFVISGFVLAYSVRCSRVDGRFAIEFLRRRSIRLVPPYWFAIAAAIAAMWLSRRLFDNELVLPSVGRIAAHLVYLQGFLGYEHIYPIFWTLCHEVQFYLIFLVALWLGQWLSSLAKANTVKEEIPTGLSDLSQVVFSALFLASGIASGTGAFKYPGACLDTWYLFVLGIVAYRCVFDELPLTWFALYTAALFSLRTSSGDGIEMSQKVAGVATAMLLIFAGRTGRMATLGDWRAVQFVGKVSYSLYLMHGIVGYPLLSVGHRLTGESPVAAAGWMTMAIVFALLVATVTYQLVERPCLRRRRSRVE